MSGGQQANTSHNKKAGYGSSMTTFTEADRRKILESLTADEMATFQEAFTVFDKNQDGTITTKVSFLKLMHTVRNVEFFSGNSILAKLYF